MIFCKYARYENVLPTNRGFFFYLKKSSKRKLMIDVMWIKVK